MSEISATASKIEFERYSNESWALVVSFSYGDLANLIISLQILFYDLGDAFVCYTKDGSLSVTVLLTEANVSNIEKISEKKFKVALSRNDAEVWTAFMLKYFRENQASVDHIDIEVETSSNLGSDGTLLLKALEYASPLTAEEAKKRLM